MLGKLPNSSVNMMGGLALGVNNVRAQFDRLSTRPMKVPMKNAIKQLKEKAMRTKVGSEMELSELEPGLLKGSGDGGWSVIGAALPNNVVGINGGMAAPDKVNDITVTKEEEVDWKVCVFTTNPKKWCADSFSVNRMLRSQCEINFCDTCCGSSVPAHKKSTHLSRCQKLCR